MKQKSIWNQSVNINKFPSLNQDLECEIVIVGGGLCGLLTAYYLSLEGKQVVVLEKDLIGKGKTSLSTAVITLEHDILYSTLIKKLGFNKAKTYLMANLSAIKEYKSLADLFDFDFEEKPNILYSTKNVEMIEKEYRSLLRLGLETKLIDQIELPFEIQKALVINNQAMMNPMKLINNLSKRLTIYENSQVTKVYNDYLICNNFKVKAKKIIITSHFPFINKVGLYFAKMYQKKSFVIAISNFDKLNATYSNLNDEDFYFRDYHGYLLIGGNDKRVGSEGVSFDNLVNFAKKKFPNCKVEYFWSNQDCVSLDQVPYIGRYSHFYSNVYVATGFNLWGMTNSLISAKILTDLIMARHNPYYQLYQPFGRLFKKQLLFNLGNFVKDLLVFKKPRCTHMGCALLFNEIEGVYECSCHGTKYDKDGNIICSPGIKKLNHK